ncbi:MAG: DNA repair protein RecO [Clostridia bacterium]|nr:DNA repair protein RecO [Clostridia bacterium]
MEVKVNAAVLRATDYGENDRILTLLSAEEGKITATAKGVKKAGAKLKFAAQPFVFCEYVLTSSKGRYIVTSAAERESFYDIREDIVRFYAASAASELTESLSVEEYPSGEILAAYLRCLEGICTKDPSSELVRYLLRLFAMAGLAVEAGDCPVCGEDLEGRDRLRFDFNAGTFTCAGCSEAPAASPSTYRAVRALGAEEYGGENGVTDDGVKRAVRLLCEYAKTKTTCRCRSMTELIRMM